MITNNNRMEEDNNNTNDTNNMKSLLSNAMEGWKEALDLANYRQAMVDSSAREMELLSRQNLEADKVSRVIIDEINLITLQLANEVISRQALNENTNYTNITSSSSSSSSSIGSINDNLGTILERLKAILGVIGTQDLLLTKSRDDVKKMHTLFVSEKRKREAREEMERQKEEMESRIREDFEVSLLNQQHNYHQNCEIITEEASILTEDTSSLTKKKIKKKIAKK